MPEISVIVPVYKVEKFIYRCVESILNQTFSDFELILVDDGSPDSCPHICDEYAKKDSRVHVIHKQNGGLSDARNVGKEKATGNYITFVDSDDWIHEKYLERLYNACLCFDAEVSVCGYFRTENKELNISAERFTVKTYSPEDFWCSLELNHAIAPWGKLYKRELDEGIQFPVGKLHEDVFTTHEYIFAAQKIAFFPAEMYYYYINPDSITGKGWYPKRMDAVEAFRIQTEFFHKNGFKHAEKRSAEKYVDIAIGHYSQLCQLNQYDDIRKDLKKEIRKALIKYKKYIKSKKEWEYIYFQFFPVEMKLRNYCVQAKKKIFGD